MKNIKIIFIILVIIICYLLLNNNYNIDTNKMKVELVNCIDGDTAKFIVNGKEEKVRFLGIDTPESTNYMEEYGMTASSYTCNMLKKTKNIYLEYDFNSDRYDKYDRLLAYVFIDNNNLNELLLSKGYAEVKYVYGEYKYISTLCKAQKSAYDNNLGIWNIGYNYEDNYCVKNNY